MNPNLDKISHAARMVFGSVDDLKCSLNHETNPEHVEEALALARTLRDCKTKVTMLERKLRQLRKGANA